MQYACSVAWLSYFSCKALYVRFYISGVSWQESFRISITLIFIISITEKRNACGSDPVFFRILPKHRQRVEQDIDNNRTSTVSPESVAMPLNASSASAICKGTRADCLKIHDRGYSVSIDWVSAHTGIEGNEKTRPRPGLLRSAGFIFSHLTGRFSKLGVSGGTRIRSCHGQNN